MDLKKIFFIFFFIVFTSSVFANIPRSIGKYKNWESYTIQTDKGKICFAQTKPVKRSPSSIKRKESETCSFQIYIFLQNTARETSFSTFASTLYIHHKEQYIC